jgi:phosphoribosylamine--glycine ligase
VVIRIDNRIVVTVVAVSGGYPGGYEKGKVIEGLGVYETVESIVFHSGTQQKGEEVLTNGGRVLAITSFGNSIKEAGGKSKKLLRKIYFEGINFRQDIGYEFE